MTDEKGLELLRALSAMQGMAEALSDDDDDDASEVRDLHSEYALTLKRRAAVLGVQANDSIKAGDLVRWRPGFKFLRRPRYDEVMLVVEKLRDPTPFSQDPKSHTFGCRAD